MTYLLDSNACIGWLRQSQPKLVDRRAAGPLNEGPAVAAANAKSGKNGS